jgi:DNA-binding Xre family transcriptional regulator
MRYNPDEECDKLMNHIKMLCEQKTLKHHAVAVKAEMSSSTIHNLMSGKTKPYVHTLYKLCNALDVSVEEILSMSMDGDETADEKELLFLYRSLSAEKKNLSKMFLEMLKKYEETE